VPTLDLAATELGGDGFPGSPGRRGGIPFKPREPVGVGVPELGGVARLPRFCGTLGDIGGSGLSPSWYWPMPDHSLSSAETGDMVPLRPFISVGLEVWESAN
jgi:hypothetical protein